MEEVSYFKFKIYLFRNGQYVLNGKVCNNNYYEIYVIIQNIKFIYIKFILV